MILVTVGMPTTISLRDLGHSWTASSVAGEYYVRTSHDLNPNLTEPDFVQRNGVYFTKGTVGLLNKREWGWALAPGQSYYTVYIRLYDGSNPGIQTNKDITATHYTDYRCSNEAIPLEHYWYPYAMSFGSIKYQIDQIYGGYCRLSYGEISFMPELFVDYWPPPPSLKVVVEYTDTTESESITLFVGNLHLKSINTEEITYDIYDAQDYQINTLQESITNDSDQIDIRNSNYKWTLNANNTYYLQLADGGGYPALGKPDAVLANYVELEYNDEMTSAGISIGEWGFGDVNSLGYDTIYARLEDDTDPDTKDASWMLAVYGVNPLPMAFGDVRYEKPVRLIDLTPGGNYRYWLADIQGTVHTDWHVYDDGVDICSNVVNVEDGVFELNAVPIGDVSISGTGRNNTLLDAFQWACSGDMMDITLNSVYAIDPSSGVDMSMSYYLSSQLYIPDFLSNIASFFTHLFYIRNGTLYLVNMLIPSELEATSEFDFFDSQYTYNAPVKRLVSTFPVRAPGEWADGSGGSSGVYVKETMAEISISSDYPYGTDDMEIASYAAGRSHIKYNLFNILNILNRPQVSMSVPFGANIISPGAGISWVNESFPYNLSTLMFARSIIYNFDNHEINIEGDCEVSS